ncbi:hypothetical protein HGG74_17660, partial [Arthrobacter sp. E918]|nr:hypothetical protein [Arthrobacter mobilis]
MRIRNLGIAGMAAWFIAGSTGTAALAAPSEDSPGNSSASIGLNGCVLSSTKDISNIG